MKKWWRKWTYELPLAFSDALWNVCVVQFAAFLDQLTLRKTIERQFDQFMKNPADPEVVKRLLPAVHLARSLPFEVVLWSAQNAWFDIKRTAIDELAARNDAEGDAHVLIEQFRQLGEELRISVN